MYVDIHDLEIRANDIYLDGNWNFNVLYTNIPPGICDCQKFFSLDLIQKETRRFMEVSIIQFNINQIK